MVHWLLPASPSVRTLEGAHPGDASFAGGYLRLVIRYELQNDLVPRVPPSIMFRHLFAAEPFFAPLIAIDDRVDYAPAGVLRFIDWSAQFRNASTMLSTEAAVPPVSGNCNWSIRQDPRRPLHRLLRRLLEGRLPFVGLLTAHGQ